MPPMFLRSIKSIILVNVILLFASISLFAQTEHENHDEHHFQHHRLALFTGYGLIPGAVDEDGNDQMKIIPIIGLDYEYFFNHTFGIGLLNDLELSTYSIEQDHQDYLERNYAFVSALVFLYEPYNFWSLYAGPGYEFEKNHGFGLIKVGTELTKNFNDGWGVGVAASYDFKEVNSSFSIGLTASKRLGK